MSAPKYRLVVHRAAVGEIESLSKKIKPKVIAAIDALAEDPRPPGAAALRGRKSAFRLRVGEYRVLYEIHATEIVVYVVAVGHRRDVYVRTVRRR